MRNLGNQKKNMQWFPEWSKSLELCVCVRFKISSNAILTKKTWKKINWFCWNLQLDNRTDLYKTWKKHSCCFFFFFFNSFRNESAQDCFWFFRAADGTWLWKDVRGWRAEGWTERWTTFERLLQTAYWLCTSYVTSGCGSVHKWGYPPVIVHF